MEQVEQIEIKKKKPIWRKVLGNGLYLIFIVAIVFGLPRLLSSVLNTPYPMAAITSGSMWPVLEEGDLVFVKGIMDQSELQIGDIIVYRAGTTGGFTIHRIVAMKDASITTKGDANFGEDAPIVFKDVVGKTVTIGGKTFRIPYLGSVTVFASNLKNDSRTK